MNSIKRASLALFLIQLALSQPYDAIFVGMGTANSIALTKMVTSFPQKSFLVLEMGGPTTKSVGGTNIPSYFESQSAANQETIFDVPGEYQNIAFQPQGEPYKIPQTFTWQGMGYGGNSQFNGMLFMSPPSRYLDALPSPWKSSNLSAVFTDLRSRMTVTKTPSTDGKNYLNEITNIMAPGMDGANWQRSDTSDLSPLETLQGYYNEPYVVTDGNGMRGGPITAYLTSIIGTDGKPKSSNLQVVAGATVSSIVFDAQDPTKATGVQYTAGGIQQTATLNAGGRIIVGAGALMTPRLLYLSGVGPTGKESEVFASNPVTFARNNQKVGTVFDHVGVPIVLEYDGTTTVDTINYGDYPSNTEELNAFVNGRTGPYCQYGPVLTAHFRAAASSAHPDVEIFVNPNAPDSTTGKSFQAVFMLLEPNSNDLLSMDGNSNLKFPGIYLSTTQDKDQMANAIYTFLNEVVPKVPGLKVTQGPADATSLDSVKAYIDNIGTFIMNHFTGTVPLTEGNTEDAGGVEPSTLRVRGTSNVHVVDASLLPNSIPAHPVAMVMALGSKAGDLLVDLLNSEAAGSATGVESVASSGSADPNINSNSASPTVSESPASSNSASENPASSDGVVNPPINSDAGSGVNRQQQNSAVTNGFSMIVVASILLSLF